MKKLLITMTILLLFIAANACEWSDESKVLPENGHEDQSKSDDTNDKNPSDHDADNHDPDDQDGPTNGDAPVDDEGVGEKVGYFDFYYVNDLHGAILEDGDRMGMAKIGNLLLEKQNANPDHTVILAGGDMVHGGMLAGETFGGAVVELMNMTKFDALVAGNHEFDWGLPMVTRYFLEENEHYMADFPLLGANIHYKGTDQIAEGIDPYTIIGRGNRSIGVIGTMGEGLESSILATFVEDYEFKSQAAIVEEYATYLREDHEVDMVVLLTHGGGWRIEAMDDPSLIDIVFDGHTHSPLITDAAGVPRMVSGAYGSHIGHVRYDFDEASTISMQNLNQENESLLKTPHPEIQSKIDAHLTEYSHLFETILTSDGAYGRFDLTLWIARLMESASEADIAFHNSGGTRSDIDKAQSISVSTMYDVFPFDNALVTFDILGKHIDINATASRSLFDIEADKTYRVAVHTYTFYHPNNDFSQAENIHVQSGVLIRNLMIEEMRLQSEIYAAFCVHNPPLISPQHIEDREIEIQP